jgi:methylmalonyl-CoA mutase
VPGATTALAKRSSPELGELSSLVDGEVFDGMDVVAFLDDLLDRLGAPADPTSPPEGER